MDRTVGQTTPFLVLEDRPMLIPPLLLPDGSRLSGVIHEFESRVRPLKGVRAANSGPCTPSFQFRPVHGSRRYANAERDTLGGAEVRHAPVLNGIGINSLENEMFFTVGDHHMRFMNLIPLVFCMVCFLAGPALAASDQLIGGDMGTYIVHCNVDGASVAFDGAFKGTIAQGVCYVPVYTTGTPYKGYSVSKQGYTTYNGPVLSVPAAGSTIDLYSTLEVIPTQTPGNLNILTSPPLCDIYINGVLSGKTDGSGVYIQTNIIPATYTVEARKTGYGTETKTVTVPADSIIKVSFTLKQVTTGSVAVTSTPAGANIYLDDVYTGITPLTVSDVAAGEHRMTVKAPGYQDMTVMVTIISGQSTPVSVSLTAVPPPSTKPTATKTPLSPALAVVALCGSLLGIAKFRRK